MKPTLNERTFFICPRLPQRWTPRRVSSEVSGREPCPLGATRRRSARAKAGIIRYTYQRVRGSPTLPAAPLAERREIIPNGRGLHLGTLTKSLVFVRCPGSFRGSRSTAALLNHDHASPVYPGHPSRRRAVRAPPYPVSLYPGRYS